MNDYSGHSSTLLAMRILRVVGPRCHTTEATVHCPARARSLPTTECLHCGACEGTLTRPDGRILLRCAHPAAQPARAELMPQPLFSSVADATPLSEVMTHNVVCVLADLEAHDLIDLLIERDISGVPVVDGAGWPIGVASKSDLLRGFPSGATVADVMAPMAFTLCESATLAQAAALMAFEGVHRIVVVSDEGRVVGVVSSLDIARWVAESAGYIEPGSTALASRST